MELTEGSENQDWFCNFCKRNSWDFEEKVQAWRCPQDIRDLKEQIGHIENTTRPLSVPIRASAKQARLNTTGCDYDICNQCIKEYRVRLQHIQPDIKAFLAKAVLLLYCFFCRRNPSTSSEWGSPAQRWEQRTSSSGSSRPTWSGKRKTFLRQSNMKLGRWSQMKKSYS